MFDVGDLYDIDTKYDFNYDCTLGLKLRGTKVIDGAVLRQISNRNFEIVFDKEILGELEIGV